MAQTAILFPGQGSQTDDMRETVERVRPDLLPSVAELVGEGVLSGLAKRTLDGVELIHA